MSSGEGKESTIKEVPWTDDVIRWQGGLHGEKAGHVVDDHALLQSSKCTDDDDTIEDDGCMIDPFKDPDPTELQTFRFRLPCSSIHDTEALASARNDTTNNSHNNNNNDDDQSPSSPEILEVLIRGYKTNADEVWKSTGLTLWKASHYLCQYQVENAHTLFRGNRVLELGAGLGLNGILAWKIMCAQSLAAPDKTPDENATLDNCVCITDGDSDALVHLRKNIHRNRTENSSNHVRVSCHQLLWGASTSLSFLQHIAHNRKYHVILASDIIYAPSIIAPLWETIQTLLDRTGVFVMAFARRKVPVSIELVLKEAERYGFGYELAKEDTEEGIWVYTFKFA